MFVSVASSMNKPGVAQVCSAGPMLDWIGLIC